MLAIWCLLQGLRTKPISTHKSLKERDYLKDPICDTHDDENTYEGTGHQENGSFKPPFFKKEANDACRKNSKPRMGRAESRISPTFPRPVTFFKIGRSSMRAKT